MRFPFVSRERLEEAQQRLVALEDERRILLDRLAELRGEPPIFSKPVVAPIVVSAPAETLHVATHSTAMEEKPMPKTLAGSSTFDHVLRAASDAVRDRNLQRAN